MSRCYGDSVCVLPARHKWLRHLLVLVSKYGTRLAEIVYVSYDTLWMCGEKRIDVGDRMRRHLLVIIRP
jgi:hypothetical protein